MLGLCNGLIKGLATPAYKAFVSGNVSVQQHQEHILMQILKQNQQTLYGREYEFSSIKNVEHYQKHVPIRDYDGLLPYIEQILKGGLKILTAESVLMVEPTSGSSAASKYIPYTASLKKQYMQGIKPWMYDLYVQYPELLQGQAYWSISPVQQRNHYTEGGLPIGFETDTGYFSTLEGLALGRVFPVGGAIKQVYDIQDFQYLTILNMLRGRHLRLISVWNPSFLIQLLKVFNNHGGGIIQDLEQGRVTLPSGAPVPSGISKKYKANTQLAKICGNVLERKGYTLKDLWPQLKLVSCWTEAGAAVEYKRLQPYLEGVDVQGKGLLATEGVVTIPFRGHNVLAYQSHFYEFIHEESQQVLPAWALKEGHIYSVVITTAGGLYRYPLYDQVQVTDFWGAVPVLRFLGRQGHTLDLCGEKLHQGFVAQVLAQISGSCFSFLAPFAAGDGQGYCLYIEGSSEEVHVLAREAERLLSQNIHYAYARQLGQLKPLKVYKLKEGAEFKFYQLKAIRQNTGVGNLKPPIIEKDANWHQQLEGILFEWEVL